MSGPLEGVRIIDLALLSQGLLSGEAMILRDAIDLLDDLATTLDKILSGGSGSLTRGYEVDTTQQLKIIRNDDHGGNRP